MVKERPRLIVPYSALPAVARQVLDASCRLATEGEFWEEDGVWRAALVMPDGGDSVYTFERHPYADRSDDEAWCWIGRRVDS